MKYEFYYPLPIHGISIKEVILMTTTIEEQ